MKVAILAGGFGTRLSEETAHVPKPMVEIGGKPILWHIMMHYSTYGFNEFVIALGYRGEYIKRFMLDQARFEGDVSIDFRTGEVSTDRSDMFRNWKMHLIETGLHTQTGGRIKQLQRVIGRERFMLTWGDGVSNVDIRALIDYHESHGRIATVTAVRPRARFGHLAFNGDRICEFSEKPETAEGWINGAFFVLEPAVFDYIDGDDTSFEREPMTQLARDGQLIAFQHKGFWQCMDTLREKNRLEELWSKGDAPWKTW